VDPRESYGRFERTGTDDSSTYSRMMDGEEITCVSYAEDRIMLIREGDLVGRLTDFRDDTSLLEPDEWQEGVTLLDIQNFWYYCPIY
jgi:uncharacterized beta-barrel protein YwiB (DUF1934 family)